MYLHKRNGKWLCQISWYEPDPDHPGKEKRHFKTKLNFRTKAQAQLWGNQQENAKNQGQLTVHDPSFAAYYQNWAETFRMPGRAYNTVNRYKHIEKLLLKYFGNEKFKDVTRAQYQQFIKLFGKDHSKETVTKINHILRSCVRDALDDGIIHKNFATRINVVWNKNHTRKIEYLSINEIQRLTEAVKSNLRPHFTSRYMILTGIYTGMRVGEVMALKWQDINFVQRTIRINKSYDYVQNKVKPPKTANSKRVIRVNQELLDILKELQANHQQFVFANPNGNIPSDNAVNKALRNIMKQAGINKRGFHFHSLRHCHVAYLAARHVDWYAISKRLGHSDVAFTMKQYSYLIDEMKSQEDSYIEQVLNDIGKSKNIKII